MQPDKPVSEERSETDKRRWANENQMERWREYLLDILNRNITKNEVEEDEDDVENQ
jgi:hypothetical protein